MIVLHDNTLFLLGCLKVKKSLYPLINTGSTQENRKIVDMDVKQQNKCAMTWDFQQCGMCDKQRLRPACSYAQTDRSLWMSLIYSMILKLLTEHHLEFLILKGGWSGSSESTLVKTPHYWKSHVAAQMHLLTHFTTGMEAVAVKCLNSRMISSASRTVATRRLSGRCWASIDALEKRDNETLLARHKHLIGPRHEKTCLWGFATKRDSNQSPQLQRLARKMRFRL